MEPSEFRELSILTLRERQRQRKRERRNLIKATSQNDFCFRSAPLLMNHMLIPLSISQCSEVLAVLVFFVLFLNGLFTHIPLRNQ